MSIEVVDLVTVPGVELAATGTWNASTGTTTFTQEDFAAAVGALDCPGVRNPVLKLGHDEEDSTSGIRWDGEPAVGWIANMRLNSSGTKLVGDYTGMPDWLATVLPSAYPDRSIEIYRPFICQIGHAHPAVITAVALLGVQRPGVGVIRSLQDVRGLYTTDSTAAKASTRMTVTVGGVHYLASTKGTSLGRELTKVEEAAKTDFLAVQWQWEDALDRLVAAWSPISAAWRDELHDGVQKAIKGGRWTSLVNLDVDTTTAADVLEAHMLDLCAEAVAEMRGEAARQGVEVPEVPVVKAAAGVPTSILRRVAEVIAAMAGKGLSYVAGKRAIQAAAPGVDAEEVATIVLAHMEELSITALRDQLGVALSTAQNTGRITVMKRAPSAAYYASEVLDARTCKNCRQVDGQRFADLEEVQAAYTNGGYVDCLGHLRCRGTVVAVWDELATASTAHRFTVPLALRIEGGARGHQGRHVRIG